MIVNTELEQKGNLFPSQIIKFKKDVDTLYFYTENNVSFFINSGCYHSIFLNNDKMD